MGVLAVLLVPIVQGCAVYHPKPLTPSAVEQALTVPSPAVIAQGAATLRHPILQPVVLDPRQPLAPREAAVLAVLINPKLRAMRDKVGVAQAQVISAGLLPNPQINAGRDWVVSGPAVTYPYAIGASWDFTALLTRNAKIQGARASLASVRLDVAWAEWQTAEAAKATAFDVVALDRQVKAARAIEERHRENLRLVQDAYDRHQMTILQLSAARTAASTAEATALALEQKRNEQRLKLFRALGLPAETPLAIRSDTQLPSQLNLPPAEQLLDGLQERRLDLLALQRGYESQEETVRAAILAQFPKITIGPAGARDNSDVNTIGFSATIELPIFDRNQGKIAHERATRQRLYDEYVNRVFQAKSDVAKLLTDVDALTRQISAAKAALPALQNLVEVSRAAAEDRITDVQSYYKAWNEFSNKQIDLLKLQQKLASDWISLELAVAEELPQSLKTASITPASRPQSISPGGQRGVP